MGLYEIAITGSNGVALRMLGIDRRGSLFLFRFSVGLFLFLSRESG